jgi:hypothetical protein
VKLTGEIQDSSKAGASELLFLRPDSIELWLYPKIGQASPAAVRLAAVIEKCVLPLSIILGVLVLGG